jgi:phenylalanyl-tRNA synthetase beta chain
MDIFDLKGCIEVLLKGLHIETYRFEPGCEEPFISPKTGISIFIGDAYCGFCGTIHPDVAENFAAVNPVHVFELDFHHLCAYYSDRRNFTPFSRYPAVQRDLALIIDQSVTVAEVSAAIASFKNNLLKQWHVFDFYQGGSVPEGKKSIAYRLTFKSDERTLTDNEVNKINDKLIDTLRVQLGVELR